MANAIDLHWLNLLHLYTDVFSYVRVYIITMIYKGETNLPVDLCLHLILFVWLVAYTNNDITTTSVTRPPIR